MIIDIYSHISPVKYIRALQKLNPYNPDVQLRLSTMNTALSNIDLRFSHMDKFESYVQVLTLATPPIEQVADGRKAAELAKIANDEMAELTAKYPDRFIAAIAALPMNNLNNALKEVDRAINDLKMKGVQIYTNINNKPLDSPDLLPLYEKMSIYDLPIWIHPTRSNNQSDYNTENKSLYRIVVPLLGWPHETSVAMARLAYSGVLERYPKLKFITHHCGGTIPYLAGRLTELGSKESIMEARMLNKAPIEYLKTFYGDTATYGQVPALMCGFHFFGPEHMLFGSDMPLGSISEPDISGVRLAINAIDQMEISELEKNKIFRNNAEHLLHV